MDNQKEYIIVYRSKEHFEVLGFVNAENIEEARKKAITDLRSEAKYYGVEEAEISEYPASEDIIFS